MKELRNIEVSHISLVKAGANGKTFIYKSKSEPNCERLFKIAKSDEERGVIYGIVYAPDQVDSQGDLASASEIERAAYGFMKARNTLNVDSDHDEVTKDAFVAESWIVRKGDLLFPSESDVGSWAVAIKLESEELKSAVKKGDYEGLSMAGKAERVEVDKSKSEGFVAQTLNAILELLKSKEKKENKVGQSELETAFKSAVEPIASEVKKLGEGLEEVKRDNASLKKKVDGFEGSVKGVEEALKKSKQSDNLQDKNGEFAGSGVL
ncbi:MAG: XkdF-like putative serine protease domain-containing protein [Helicobacteraceae bacterium]|nr:XkdF-like putative serine protease domain-containing protein [Helicobacteraceae bacterium]